MTVWLVRVLKKLVTENRVSTSHSLFVLKPETGRAVPEEEHDVGVTKSYKVGRSGVLDREEAIACLLWAVGKKRKTERPGYQAVIAGGQRSKITVEASAEVMQYGGRGGHCRSGTLYDGAITAAARILAVAVFRSGYEYTAVKHSADVYLHISRLYSETETDLAYTENRE